MRNCYLSRNYKGVNGAGNKAKTDIEQVMKQNGYVNVGFPQTRYTNTILAFFATLASVLKACFSLKKGDRLVLQYPLKKYFTFVCRVAHWKGAKVVTIIHDLGSFRSKRLTVSQEIHRLRHSDVIIAHSESMKNWLEAQHLERPIVVLEIFDYLSDSKPSDILPQENEYKVMFAGVLSPKHNAFLYKLAKLPDRVFKIVLYGSGVDKEYLEGAVVEDKGFVTSDELIRTAEGHFGLVWYGPELEGGHGPLGEYLQYNAPHKMSLYLRCNSPVIIWDKAALAPFVKKYQVGLCLSSLAELNQVLSGMSVDDYCNMKRNVQVISARLAQGYYVNTALQSAFKCI